MIRQGHWFGGADDPAAQPSLVQHHCYTMLTASATAERARPLATIQAGQRTR